MKEQKNSNPVSTEDLRLSPEQARAVHRALAFYKYKAALPDSQQNTLRFSEFPESDVEHLAYFEHSVTALFT